MCCLLVCYLVPGLIDLRDGWFVRLALLSGVTPLVLVTGRQLCYWLVWLVCGFGWVLTWCSLVLTVGFWFSIAVVDFGFSDFVIILLVVCVLI